MSFMKHHFNSCVTFYYVYYWTERSFSVSLIKVVSIFFINYFLYFGVFSCGPKSKITTKFKALDISYEMSCSN